MRARRKSFAEKTGLVVCILLYPFVWFIVQAARLYDRWQWYRYCRRYER